jgi:hypothetical protein
MRSLTYALAPLPGFASPKTYAAWPVWHDSTTEEVRFVAMSLKQAAKLWQKARRFDRQSHIAGKHGGMIGRTALAVLYALLFDFLDFKTGQLDPSYQTIADKAGVCRRTVAAALARLKDLGLLHWQRRSRPEPEAGGGYRQVQITNAYAVLSPANWKGFYEPPPPPPPHPSTWGATPPLDPLAEAAGELRQGQPRTALAILDADPGDSLAAALARLGRAIIGSQS